LLLHIWTLPRVISTLHIPHSQEFTFFVAPLCGTALVGTRGSFVRRNPV
jgi:hypothetical protein